MKIVADTNRIIAALVKGGTTREGTTREILFDKNFELFAPEHIKYEISKYKEEILNKTSIKEEEFELLHSLVFEQITIVPEAEYNKFIDELKNEIKDPNDIPYLAVGLLINAEGVWTHDPHFQKQKECKVFTNIDMLKIIGNKKDFV